MRRLAPHSAASPLLRGAWAILALAHLLASGLVPAADAFHGDDAMVASSAHVAGSVHLGAAQEHDCVGSPDEPCDPGHAHDDCLLCRALSTGAVLAKGAGPEMVRAVLPGDPSSSPHQVVASSGAFSPHPARAPPRV